MNCNDSIRRISGNSNDVSIPNRDFGELQSFTVMLIRVRCLFQSLIGILVNCNKMRLARNWVTSMFQSLIGILVNCNPPKKAREKNLQVSIPNRDFGELQLG